MHFNGWIINRLQGNWSTNLQWNETLEWLWKNQKIKKIKNFFAGIRSSSFRFVVHKWKKNTDVVLCGVGREKNMATDCDPFIRSFVRTRRVHFSMSCIRNGTEWDGEHGYHMISLPLNWEAWSCSYWLCFLFLIRLRPSMHLYLFCKLFDLWKWSENSIPISISHFDRWKNLTTNFLSSLKLHSNSKLASVKIERWNLCMYAYGYARVCVRAFVCVCDVDFEVTDRSHTNPIVKKKGYVILPKEIPIAYSKQPKNQNKSKWKTLTKYRVRGPFISFLRGAFDERNNMSSTNTAEPQNASAESQTNVTDNKEAILSKHLDLVFEFPFHFPKSLCNW